MWAPGEGAGTPSPVARRGPPRSRRGMSPRARNHCAAPRHGTANRAPSSHEQGKP
ncbi:Hypothetical protein AA314_02792 [Archangium gephyra]|uniref:Uncharacterized protein n=1 Tax=Archangium gephyra TaxID=48 RepID=A0AAC8Q557_9BACT|nr:Hypothetical protein AA314_02792 [Archangium gephyra]